MTHLIIWYIIIHFYMQLYIYIVIINKKESFKKLTIQIMLLI
jgi:hypothetical protein